MKGLDAISTLFFLVLCLTTIHTSEQAYCKLREKHLSDDPRGADEESLLVSSLQRCPRYNKLVRPNAGKGPDRVTFGLNLQDVIGVEERDAGQLTATFVTYVSMKWVDPRLAWNTTRSQVRSVRLEPESIWTPDIKLYNSLEPQLRIIADVLAVVSADGTVFLVSPAKVALHCNMTNTHIHTSVQLRCAFRFGSWTYSGSDIDVQLSMDKADTSTFNSQGWSVTENTAVRTSIKYPPYPDEYPRLDYTVGLA